MVRRVSWGAVAGAFVLICAMSAGVALAARAHHKHPVHHHKAHAKPKPKRRGRARHQASRSTPRPRPAPVPVRPVLPAAPPAPPQAAAYSVTLNNETPQPPPPRAPGTKLDCIYTALSQSILASFSQKVNHDFNCVEVYNDGAANWADWEHPWFLDHQRDADWTTWATQPGTDRTLVIAQSLFPGSLLRATDWRTPGAAGAFDGHARALAANLVAAGLGGSIIRLAPEMNGDWNADSIGSSASDWQLWVQFWRHTVLAMRSVAGAHFRFDWNFNAHVNPVPLASFYPGDDVVDIVGIDAYDAGVSGSDRWSSLYNQTDGIGAAVNFAAAHGKPLSIPEWGLDPTDYASGGGDDPAYMRGIAGVVANNNVAYQSYFYNHQIATTLDASPLSFAVYRQFFGDGLIAASPKRAPARVVCHRKRHKRCRTRARK